MNSVVQFLVASAGFALVVYLLIVALAVTL